MVDAVDAPKVEILPDWTRVCAVAFKVGKQLVALDMPTTDLMLVTLVASSYIVCSRKGVNVPGLVAEGQREVAEQYFTGALEGGLPFSFKFKEEEHGSDGAGRIDSPVHGVAGVVPHGRAPKKRARGNGEKRR